jgi:hypothetical protein
VLNRVVLVTMVLVLDNTLSAHEVALEIRDRINYDPIGIVDIRTYVVGTADASGTGGYSSLGVDNG